MGLTSASLGNICMVIGEPGILRQVEIQLDFCITIQGPTFIGLAPDGFEIWEMRVAVDDTSTQMTTLTLSPLAGITSIVGIEFIVTLAGATLKKKRRGYMAAQPCG